MNQLAAVRLVRCLDGILISALIYLLALAFDSVAFDALGYLRMVFVLPILAFVWFVLGIPPELQPGGKWELVVRKMRVSAMAAAGLAPIFVWWYADMGNTYLLINAGLFALAGSCTLFFLARACRQICVTLGVKGLAWEAKLTANLIFWLHIVVAWCGTAFLVVIARSIDLLSTPDIVRSLMGYGMATTRAAFLTNQAIHLGWLFALLAPMFFFLTLTFRMRLVLMNYIRYNSQEK